MTRHVSFLHKTVVVALATALAVALLNLVGDRYRPAFLSLRLQAVLSAVFLAAIPVQILLWQRAAAKHARWAASALPFFQGLLVWCIAAIFFRFAALKLLGLHMNTSLVYDDMPAGSLSGYALMDYFFGRAPGFKVLLAVLQLTGAGCLLFRRTRLPGIVLLLPVIANIVLMDGFYQVGVSITVVALLLLLGLCYLLVQNAPAIRAALLRAFQGLPRLTFSNRAVKPLVRLSAVLLPVALLLVRYHPPRNAAIAGKYDVRLLPALPGQDRSASLDSIPSVVYFDENDDCIFRYTAYDRLKVGKALFDAPSGRLTVAWRYPLGSPDTLQATLSAPDAQHRRILSGFMGTVPVRFQLTAVRLPQAGS